MNYEEFQPTDLEFFAESKPVEIVPNFQGDVLNFISGDFGPFKPGIPTKVPLWLGIYLKKRSKCKITPPEWMSAEFLTEKLNEEKALGNEFAELPFYFEEITSLILKNASDDFKDSSIVRGLIEDILNLRWSKLQQKLSKLQVTEDYIDLKGLTNMEVNKVKKSIENSFTILKKIKSIAPEKVLQANSDGFSHFASQSFTQ